MSGGETAMILTLGICGVCVLAILKVVADALQTSVERKRLVADCENLRTGHANRVRHASERREKTLKAARRATQKPINNSAAANPHAEPELAKAA